MEALDAAAVEAALSLCEEAVSEGHTLPGPWETQELKASDPGPTVQESDPTQEPQDVAAMSALIPAGTETQNQPETKTEEQLKGNCEGPEVTGSDVTSDDGATGSEVTEEGAAGKEATETTVKSEGEEWSQPEPNPPCLGGWCTYVDTHRNHAYIFLFFLSSSHFCPTDSEDSSVSGKESKVKHLCTLTHMHDLCKTVILPCVCFLESRR